MPRFPCVLLLLGLLGAFSATAASVRVRECSGANGERVFSDRRLCANSIERILLTDEPEIVAAVPVEQRRSRTRRATGGRGQRRAAAESYLCTTGGRSWYQHSPCGAQAGSGKKRETIRQTRVARARACREIDRPAALLRRGSERDERAGPYAKATGRDPCR